MKKRYSFAGLEIEAVLPEDMEFGEEHKLMPFAHDAAEDPYRFYFEMMEQVSAPRGECIVQEPALRVYAFPGGTVRYIGAVSAGWENAHIRVEQRGKENFVQLKASQFAARIGSKTVLNSIGAEHLIAQNGGFVFHSAFIEVAGKAVLFTAPSGTGKSTQAALWEQYRAAEVINGDRSAVRFADGKACACGIPFAGSSNICKNKTLPLAAVVYLKQAPENTIRRLRGAEAFCRIWEGCSVNTWDKADVAAVSDVVQRIACTVPVYELACTPDEQAVIWLEETLKKEGSL